MTSPNKLNEFNHAEDPARLLLERLGWTYVPRESLAAGRGDEREVLLKDRLSRALLRLNEWITEEQAGRAVFELEHVNATGMARNQRVHEYMTYGIPLAVDTSRGRETRIVRFFDFEHPEGGLNEFVVTTQFRVRRGNERTDLEDDERVVKPDLVLFVNGIPLVVMEAKSPSLLEVWKSQAVRQLRRYQEAGPEWHGAGAPELFHYNLLCVAHCGAAAAYATLGAPENAYMEWKSVQPYSEEEVWQRFGVEPQGQAQLIVGLLSPSTLLDILRDYVVYDPERGRLIKKGLSPVLATGLALKQLEQCLNLFWSQQTPMIVAPDILSKIEGQPFSADSPFGCQTPLEITPEALQAVDVAPLPIAERLAVVHKPVDVAPHCDARVAGKGVRADDGATLHALVQERQQRLGFHVRYHLRPHQATSTQDPKDSLLSGSTAPLRALNTLCQAPVAPGTSQVGHVDLHHAGEDMGNVPDHGLAHHDQGSQDSLSLQAGLLGNHLGTLPQDEPAQQSPPLPWRQPKRQRPGHPLVVAGCTTTLTSPNAPALGVLTSRAPNLPSHATILSQVAVLGLYPKKLPRYQQYRAVGTALERIRTGHRPEERGGVVWHTQGSGKSLTMLWVATKLRREPRLGNPTIVVVTDRRQLDKQIANTFERCGFPAPEQASSTRHLHQLLTIGAGRTVMTTIQKFEDALTTPTGSLEVLNPSENVIVMVDEAHRTQYGTLGALMSRALPNATLIGFIGTPIDKGFRRSTMRRFGALIDSYTIPQSVADGATVPIFYEARLPELAIEGPETLDRLFDAMFGDEPEEVQEQIRRRYANKETVAEAEQRIQMIALDIAEHFKSKVRPNGFKAQVVTPSRAAALRYAEHLKSFGISAYPIITSSHNDGPEFKAARDIDQEQITNAFVDPEGEPEVLVVVDMLLTGFDAPPEQVLYLDRSIQEHSLLQAIARVNWRFSHEHDGVLTEKKHGLVVDYHGVSRDLQKALSSFDWPDVQDTMTELEEEPGSVIEAAAVQAESHLRGRDLRDTWACVSLFAPDVSTEGDFKADLFERFNADYRHFSALMDRYLPDPRALDYVGRLARLTEIRAYVRAQFLREDADVDWTDIGAKVKRLVDERIDAQVRELMKPVSVLDNDFEQKIAALPHDEARASIMEHAIRAEIHERLAENPVFYEKLSQQLARIIEDLRNRVIDAAEACRREEALRRQIRSEADIAAQHGLSPVSFAIYELLEVGQPGIAEDRAVREERGAYRTHFDDDLKRVAVKVDGVLNRHKAVVDWQSNLEVQREMRRDIKRELRDSSDYTEEQLDELANRIVELARRRDRR